MITEGFAWLSKQPILIAVMVLIFLLAAAIAEENNGLKIPEGMEMRVVGQTRLVVPQGAKIYKKEGLIIVESIDEYVSRSFAEMRKTIEALENQQKEMLDEIQRLKDKLKTQVEK